MGMIASGLKVFENRVNLHGYGETEINVFGVKGRYYGVKVFCPFLWSNYRYIFVLTNKIRV